MTDFTWVKEAARRKAVLKDYLELRKLMESEIDNIGLVNNIRYE